jgi:C-methyltransferase
VITININQLVVGAWPAKALSVAATLSVADTIGDGASSHAEIAAAADCDAAVTLRLLQVLTKAGVFEEEEPGVFRNTAQSQVLRSDRPDSLRYVCMLAGGMYYDAFGGLLHTAKTGGSGFEHVFGANIYQHMERNPDDAFVYNKAMEALAWPVAMELVRTYDFARAERIVDVGGGFGGLIKGVLRKHPEKSGVCVDRESVCDAARENLRGDDLEPRLSYETADFFVAVPDGDCYFLKNVLHNWNADSGAEILKTIQVAMAEAADRDPRLLVIEPLADGGENDALGVLFQMVVCEVGAERFQKHEVHNLLEGAGLEPVSDWRLATGHTVFEARLA